MPITEFAIVRVTVTDGEDIPNQSFTSSAVGKIIGIRLVPVYAHAGGVTYDIIGTFLAGAVFNQVEYAIKSNIKSGPSGTAISALVDVGGDVELATDVHKRDATNGVSVTNIVVLRANTV